MEAHLADCSPCRDRVQRMMSTEKLLRQQLPREQAPGNAWKAIVAGIASSSGQRKEEVRPRRFALRGWSIASAAMLVAAVILFTMANSAAHRHGAFDFDDFRPVPLSKFSTSAEPHVVTEGYVAAVNVVREKDGDLTFKLVDDIHRPTHFVVCEIIPGFRLDAPRAGTRIRVYGVNRFDNKTDHQWFEVHPVLNIEELQ